MAAISWFVIATGMSALVTRIGVNHGVFFESLLLWSFGGTPNALKHILVMSDFDTNSGCSSANCA